MNPLEELKAEYLQRLRTYVEEEASDDFLIQLYFAIEDYEGTCECIMSMDEFKDIYLPTLDPVSAFNLAWDAQLPYDVGYVRCDSGTLEAVSESELASISKGYVLDHLEGILERDRWYTNGWYAGNDSDIEEIVDEYEDRFNELFLGEDEDE